MKIVDALTDLECDRLRNLLATPLPDDALAALDGLAVLPRGIHSLIKETDRD